MNRIKLEAEGVRRDGRWLHSVREPSREAGLWVSARPPAQQGLIFVLGLGAGFHLREWQRQRPDLCLVACDFDADLFHHAQLETLVSFQSLVLKGPGLFGLRLSDSNDFHRYSELLLHRGYSVFRFRPAWSGRESEFLALEDQLLYRRLPSLNESSGDLHDLEMNIKGVTQPQVLESINDAEERKTLLALRELVA